MLSYCIKNHANFKIGDRFDPVRALLADIGLTLVPPKLGELLPPLIKAGLTGREIRCELILTEARLRLAASPKAGDVAETEPENFL